MATFYFDENVSGHLAILVRAAKHDVVTAQEMGTLGWDDDAQLFLARQHAWVFVTHNLTDFRLIHDTLSRWAAEWQRTDVHAGIVGLSVRPPLAEKARLLDIFIADGLPTANMLYEWRDPGGWTRRPP